MSELLWLGVLSCWLRRESPTFGLKSKCVGTEFWELLACELRAHQRLWERQLSAFLGGPRAACSSLHNPELPMGPQF
jgi:hypothetical protein